jgi:hypothetical protein
MHVPRRVGDHSHTGLTPRCHFSGQDEGLRQLQQRFALGQRVPRHQAPPLNAAVAKDELRRVEGEGMRGGMP